MFKTKFFADASRIESAYILKASTENFCKGTIFENQNRSNDGPYHQSIKRKMIVELLMLLVMTRMKMVIRMRSSDQHSRGCQ